MICPKCKQEGGVLLLNMVAPCDLCLKEKDGKPIYRLVSYDGDVAPEGAMAWCGWATMKDRDLKFKEMTDGCHTLTVASVGSEYKAIAGTRYFYCENMESTKQNMGRFPYRLAVVSLSTNGDTRKPRVVGRIPDYWQGASSFQRWAEGMEITMILRADDVPVEKCLHAWMFVEYSSAHDCMFRDLDRVVSLAAHDPNSWDMALPARSKEAASSLFKQDRVLFIVRKP